MFALLHDDILFCNVWSLYRKLHQVSKYLSDELCSEPIFITNPRSDSRKQKVTRNLMLVSSLAGCFLVDGVICVLNVRHLRTRSSGPGARGRGRGSARRCPVPFQKETNHFRVSHKDSVTCNPASLPELTSNVNGGHRESFCGNMVIQEVEHPLTPLWRTCAWSCSHSSRFFDCRSLRIFTRRSRQCVSESGPNSKILCIAAQVLKVVFKTKLTRSNRSGSRDDL